MEYSDLLDQINVWMQLKSACVVLHILRLLEYCPTNECKAYVHVGGGGFPKSFLPKETVHKDSVFHIISSANTSSP